MSLRGDIIQVRANARNDRYKSCNNDIWENSHQLYKIRDLKGNILFTRMHKCQLSSEIRYFFRRIDSTWKRDGVDKRRGL